MNRVARWVRPIGPLIAALLASLSCSENSRPSNSSPAGTSNTISGGNSASDGNTAAASTGTSMGGANGSTETTTAASSSSSGTTASGTTSGAGGGGSGATGSLDGGNSTQGDICRTGQVLCEGGCVSLSDDVAHCGDCRTPCGTGQICLAGGCTCATQSESFCTGAEACFDLSRDTDHCGACDNVCGDGQNCSDGSCGVSDPEETFTNPLNPSNGSDPWMIYYEGYYYLAATTWGDTLTLKRGRTIAELKEADPTVIWQDENPARCCNMWAPEFYLIEGPNGKRWYHYYTAGDGDDLGTQRSHVLESEGLDPMGPYHYQGQLMDYWAIDGSLVLHAGERYFMFSAWDGPTQNAWIIAMSDPWTTTGDRTLLTAPTYAWEQEGSDSVNEGPAALYHDGRTFVSYSASQCADPGYKLGLLELIGDNPLDPAAWWKSPVPVFQTANGAYGSGHNGFFISPDGSENWLVYHATTNVNGSCWTDRTTRIQPFAWNSDGLPDFGEPLPLSTEVIVPSGE